MINGVEIETERDTTIFIMDEILMKENLQLTP